MKPHGRSRTGSHMSKQDSESEESPTRESSLPRTSSKKESVDPRSEKWGKGRGCFTPFYEDTPFAGGKKLGDQRHGKSGKYSPESSIKNLSKEVRKMHLGKRKEIPAQMEVPSSRSSSSSSEEFSPKERRSATVKSAQAERRPLTVKSAQAERRPLTVKSAEKERRTSKSSRHSIENLAVRERRPAKTRSPEVESPGSRSRSSSPEKVVIKERYSVKDKSAGKEKRSSKPSLPSTENLAFRERHPAKARSPEAESPGSQSRSSSPEKLRPKHGRSAIAKPTGKERLASELSKHSSENLAVRGRRPAKTRSPEAENNGSRSRSSSTEKIVKKERYSLKVKSAEKEKRSSKSSLPLSENLAVRERRSTKARSPGSRSRSSSPEKFAPKERYSVKVRSGEKERRASESSRHSVENFGFRERHSATAKSAQAENPESRSGSSSLEKYAPKERYSLTAKSAEKERRTSKSSRHSIENLAVRERRPAKTRSPEVEGPGSRSRSSSPEKVVRKERYSVKDKSAGKEKRSSKSSLPSTENLAFRERHPAKARSPEAESPGSRSRSPSLEKYAPKERYSLTAKSAEKGRRPAKSRSPGSRSNSSSPEKFAPKERRLATDKTAQAERRPLTAKSTEKERRKSKSSRHSVESPAVRERRPAKTKSPEVESPGSRSRSSSPEKVVRKERYSVKDKSAGKEKRSSKISLPSAENVAFKDRRPATAKSENAAFQERRPATARSENAAFQERRPSTARSENPASGERPPATARLENLASGERRPEQAVDEFSLRRKSVNHLLTNYVQLQTDPDLTVFEYEINFLPEVEFKNFRYRLLYEHFRGQRDILCYDGGSKLFTPQRITNDLEEIALNHPVNDDVIIMSIKLKKRAESKDCAVVYNTLFNNCSRILRFTRFGNKYFNAEEAVDIPQHKLEIWPGYVTAIDDFEGGIQLRCDVNHRVLRTETVLEVLRYFGRRGPEYAKAMALKEIIGQCVMTRYNNNMYRIDDIDWSKTPSSTFTLKHREEISFIEYYKRQYNIDIMDTKQPLLISMSKDGRRGGNNLICLVPEICYMTGLNDRMRTDFKVMKDISKYTRITPNQRIYAFRKFLENMKNNEEVQKLLRKWGLRIMDDFVQVKAKDMEPESLLFKNNATVKTVNCDWAKSLRDLNVYRSVDIKNWIIFYSPRNRHVADDFTNIITKTGPGLGVVIKPPKKVELEDERIETFVDSMKEYIESDTQIVVCICPTAREDRYNAIKMLCCKEIPVPSQVVNATTLSREDRVRSIVQNIALQMNHKLGGAGWGTQMPFDRTMVCGVDTYHEKDHGSKSVGAFVASTSNDCTEWYSRTSFQGPKEELISGLVDAFTSALQFYHKKNGAFPDHIVVFRDGVSDGQLETCLQFEVPQLLNVFSTVTGDEYRPSFVYIIVQKRIATKLFSVVREGVENPRPGGVVDSVITRKDYIDFYLVSQLVRSGTASPTHYIVLYDNSNADLDYVQRLTYKLCHLYYNWPGTIRVPAPCQYAHKLAYLVGQNIKCVPDKSLQDKLFYL